jgi:hypothetical protein
MKVPESVFISQGRRLTGVCVRRAKLAMVLPIWPHYTLTIVNMQDFSPAGTAAAAQDAGQKS